MDINLLSSPPGGVAGKKKNYPGTPEIIVPWMAPGSISCRTATNLWQFCGALMVRAGFSRANQVHAYPGRGSVHYESNLADIGTEKKLSFPTQGRKSIDKLTDESNTLGALRSVTGGDKKMKKGISFMFKTSIVLALVTALTINAVAASVPRITKEQLRSMMDNPEIIIVDVRTGKDWKASEYKIKGAVRVNPREVESWGSQHSESKTFVFYCA